MDHIIIAEIVVRTEVISSLDITLSLGHGIAGLVNPTGRI